MLILFNDIINQIYVNDVVLMSNKLSNLMCFIRTIVQKLIEIVNYSTDFPHINEALSKSVSFLNILKALKA